MTLSTRRADPADLDRIVPLFDQYRQFYRQPSQPERCRAFLGERLARGESTLLLALQADRAIGFAQLYPLFSSVRMQSAWLLNDLYVEADRRGVGVGRALLDASIAHARRTGAAYVMLETGADNSYAQGLYERYGFQRLDPGQRFYSFATA